MSVKYTNNATTTLSAGINASVTSIGVASVAKFPSISGSDYYYATIANTNNTTIEVIKVTSASGTTLTVVRGQDGTTAQSFASGDNFQIRVTAATLESATQSDVSITGGSVAASTLTGNLSLGDNVKAQFGAGNDLQIYHDGSHSYIQDTGTGNLSIQANAALNLKKYTGETMASFNADSSVDLYYDNALKLATTSTGIDVTGNVVASGTVDGRDVATDGTKLDGIATGATNYTHPATHPASMLTGALPAIDGSSLTGVQPFPSGTVMVFYQAAAPTGWTKSTAQNNKALRVVSGSGGGTGGTWDLSSGVTSSSTGSHTHSFSDSSSTTSSDGAHTHTGASHTHTGPSHSHTGPSHTHSTPNHNHGHSLSVAAHTLTTAQMPSHTHTTTYNFGDNAGNNAIRGPVNSQVGGFTQNTGSTGSSSSHPHNVSGSVSSGGASNTGAGGTGLSGVSGTGATGASGTGSTSSSGAHTHTVAVSGTTGSSSNHTHTISAPKYIDVIICSKD